MSGNTETIVLTYEEKNIADIITNTPALKGVTYVVVTTGDELQDDKEKDEAK